MAGPDPDPAVSSQRSDIPPGGVNVAVARTPKNPTTMSLARVVVRAGAATAVLAPVTSVAPEDASIGEARSTP